jgi:DNA-binding beta-propeller fold protein YncE
MFSVFMTPAMLFGICSTLSGADQPLGLLSEAKGSTATVRFDASVQLIPGSMLAVYGPGLVRKHPLTKEVIIEDRKLVAKLQIVEAADPAKITTRITWNEGALQSGFDVVPLPKESAPNAAPAATGVMPTIRAKLEATVKVNIPVLDPDEDTLVISWSLEGEIGRSGFLSARTTTTPSVEWTAPGIPGEATIVAVIKDKFGQELVTKTKVVAEGDADWRQRELVTNKSLGYERQFPIARMTREPDGTWLGVDPNSAKVYRLLAGWQASAEIGFSVNALPTRPIKACTHGKQLHVLDGRRAGVLVYGADGNQVRDYGHGVAPTDFIVTADGTSYIADQEAGGVLVYEATGDFRVRLGRPGKGSDAFTGLSRLALGKNGEIYCLDVTQSQVQCFDRFHRRLSTWALQTDVANPAVGIAVHPTGLLILLKSGQILVADEKGQTPQAWKGLGDTGWVPRSGSAEDLFVDATGEVFVTYPEYDWMVRYDATGTPTGVRGAAQWKLQDFSMDGQGRTIGFNTSTAQLQIFDSDAWLVGQVGGLVKNGGPLTRAGAMAVSPDGRAAVVLDTSAMTVVRMDLVNFKAKPLVFGQPGKNDGQFLAPLRVAMDEAGRTYVLDAKQRRVQVFDDKGSFLFAFGRYERGKMPDELNDPYHLAVSPVGNAAYIYDDDTYEVKKFAIDQAQKKGTHVNNTGGKGDGPAQFRSVVKLAVDRLGLLYVLDDSRDDLQVIDFRGSNAVAGPVRKLTDLGLPGAEYFGLSPDGNFIVAYDGAIRGWRW